MENILKKYLHRLTNLTSRNRSLLLLNLPQEQFLDLHEVDFLDNNSSYHLINQLVSSKKEIPLCPILDSRSEKINEISKRLKKIARTETFIAEERGSHDLYVGYPFVKGKFQDGTLVRCPLLFWRVTLLQSVHKTADGTPQNKWIIRKLEDDSLSFNRSFLLAYAHYNQVNMADEWLENSFEEFDKNALVFRTQLYEFLKKSPLEINFNRDTFIDKLNFFEKLSKDDLEISELNGELKLYSQAVLGIFPQAGSFLAPDYEALIERYQKSSDTRHSFDNLFSNDTENDTAKDCAEENTFLPFQVDASQESAIKLVKQGKSLVVQGPPGTGKSQLIANLMADFAARGKRVLLVCQKRVALDTVYNRLAKIKSGTLLVNDFVALVHDFKDDRKALFEQIAHQISQIEAYKRLNQSLDAIFLERKFTQLSRQIEQISAELDEFKIALFDESICGLSIKELYLSCSPNQTHIDLDNLYKSFTFNNLHEFEEKLKHYFQYEHLLNNAFWQDRISFSKFNFSEIIGIEKTIVGIHEWQGVVKEKTQSLMNKSFDLEALLQVDETDLNTFLNKVQNLDILTIFQHLLKNKNDCIQANETVKFNQYLAELATIFETVGIEKTIPTQELDHRIIQLKRAIKASNSSISWLQWKLFSKEKSTLQNIFFSNKFSLDKAHLVSLFQKIENRLLFEKISNEFAKKNLHFNCMDTWESIESSIRNFFQSHEILYHFENLSYLKNTIVSTNDFRHALKQFIDLIQEIKSKNKQWETYLSTSQINNLLANLEDKELIISYLKNNFDSFVAVDTLKESFLQVELRVIEKLKNHQNNELDIFQNSLRLSWINHIEAVYPILRCVSSLKIKHLEESLQELVRQKQVLSQEILFIKLREASYQGLQTNRLQNIVSYRDLQHQVTKRKKIWSIRKVFEEFSEEIFKLIPCWMASPESVSAIFPLQENLFDLVIFDEASQCFSEQGVPAIYRGKQLLIAGDNKQLQPSDLYQIRYEVETNDELALEVDSLLDLAKQHLSQVQLRGHYRSQSLDLIDFSNQHFYHNSLHLLPDYQVINKKEASIKYLLVAGIWENNTNQIEAKKVVNLVHELQEKHPEKSIGIVTFNHKQANLIEDLFSYSAETFPPKNTSHLHTTSTPFYTNLSIKNIENVQGDEFDIVIFSIGYAPDLKGKMMMQFGSLNMAGGENRLNVAITRAKEKIYVVCSILPSQLQVENTINDGPKLLKKYLEYALQVSEGKYKPAIKISEKYHYSALLKSKIITTLKDEQFTLQPELPFADLTVKNKENYESLLLSDDDLYYESLSAKEAHAYLPMNLAAKGWKFERIWSRNFWARLSIF